MRKPLITIAALALFTAPALANPKLETVLGKHFDAMGGLERLRSLKSVTISGTDTFDGKSTRITQTRARPNLMRYEASGAEGTKVKAYDGKQLWFSQNGKAELAPVTNAAQMKGKMEFDDALIDAEKRGTKVALVGQEDGAYVIELTFASGDTQKRWIDAKSYLEVKRVSTWTHEGQTQSKTVTFSDYRTSAGIPSAYLTEYEHSGKRGKMVIDSIRWDSKLDLASFAPPANVAPAKAAAAAK
jgi:outer membrane lipoprotein-sorting protein